MLRKSHITYSHDNCFIVAVEEEEEVPVFLQIKYIVNFRGSWILCGRLCFCVQFARQLHSYRVNVDNSWAVIYPGEELDFSSHNFFFVDGCSYITVKYHVPKTTGF
jgi:hypothetical protein